jgi:hypothetical protein
MAAELNSRRLSLRPTVMGAELNCSSESQQAKKPEAQSFLFMRTAAFAFQTQKAKAARLS